MKTRTSNSTTATLALFLAAGVAAAGPEDANVVAGSAAFNTAGANTTITTTDGTIINYSSFDIGASETVQFIQPGAGASVLNRILNGSPTNIDGTLLSNGHVYFVNPAGVIFGSSAVVNVGHLYAAAANLSDSDFLAGRNNFTGAAGNVTNHGSITGDFVGLIGARVANYGTISAPHGTVVMAAGNNVYLSERLGQWHVKVERASDATTIPDGAIGLAAGDPYTLAAWHDGTTTAQNIHIASAGDSVISGTFAATDPSAGGLLSISGNNILIGSAAFAQAGDTIIDEASVESAINSGLDFSVVADGSITLPFDASIDKTEGGEATLTLSATDHITLDGTILNTSEGSLHLDLDAGNQINFNNTITLGTGALSAVANHLAFGQYDEPGRTASTDGVSLQAAVMELRGDLSATGSALLSTNSTIGGLSDAGFAALSDGLQIEMLGTPANNDFAIILTSDSINLNAPSWQTANGGGLRVFSTDSITFDAGSRFTLDGRFHQEGNASVTMGGQVTTTGDDILFAGTLTLNDNLLLRSNDGTDAEALIGFQGTVDGNFDLSGDAGQGRIIAMQDLGSQRELNTIRLRGKTVDLFGDATSGYQQSYIADTLTLHGSDLETTYNDTTFGFEQASIEVLADAGSGFAGNLVLAGDSSMKIMGDIEGDRVFIAGTTNSKDQGFYSLSVDSGYAKAIFGGTIGTDVDSGFELGHLEVYAAETQLHGSVYTHGMSFYSPVAIHASDSTIHTGNGVAWFGGDIYSAQYEANNVTFLYSGDPEVTLGANRTPFKFTGNVGAMEYGNGDRSTENEYAFETIFFGDDRETGINAASFLFAKQAQPGTELTEYYNDWDETFVHAYQGIAMGHGQKITSFGSLELSTLQSSGEGRSSEEISAIAIGDINVLGDLTINTDVLFFRVRAPGQVEGVGTEQNRIDGDDPQLIEDFAMELIVSGSIEINAQDIETVLPENASTASGPLVLALSGDGFEFLGDLDGQEFVLFDTIDQSLFESLLGQQPARFDDGNPLYAYDLALSPRNRKFDPNLGLGFNGIDQFEARYEGRYLPGQQVLAELALNPRSHSLTGHRDRAVAGTGIIADMPGSPTPALNDYAITLDRLSRGGVDRLTSRYTQLFGERVEEGSDVRTNTEALHASITNAWTSYRSSGGQEAAGFATWALEASPEFFITLGQLADLIDAVDSLGLTTVDNTRAHARVIERIRPTGMEFGVIEGMIQSLGLIPAQESPVVASR